MRNGRMFALLVLLASTQSLYAQVTEFDLDQPAGPAEWKWDAKPCCEEHVLTTPLKVFTPFSLSETLESLTSDWEASPTESEAESTACDFKVMSLGQSLKPVTYEGLPCGCTRCPLAEQPASSSGAPLRYPSELSDVLSLPPQLAADDSRAPADSAPAALPLPPPEFEHLLAAADHLDAAGDPDEAKRLRQQAHQLATPLSEKVDHLRMAAEHLQMAGLDDEASRLRQQASRLEQSLDREKLAEKISELRVLEQQINHLRRTTGDVQQVRVDVKVLEITRSKLQGHNFDPGNSLPDTTGLSAAELLIAASRNEQCTFEAQCPSATSPLASIGEPVKFGVVDDSGALRTLVAALEVNQIAKVLAAPALATISGRPASLHVGGEFPVPVVASGGSTAIEYRQFGTRIDVLAKVLGNQKIHLEVRPSISEIDSSHTVKVQDFDVPSLRVRQLDTTVEIESGKTLVLGGLIQRRAQPSDASQTAPVNQKSDAEESTDEVELVVLVTPTLVDTVRTPSNLHGPVVPARVELRPPVPTSRK